MAGTQKGRTTRARDSMKEHRGRTLCVPVHVDQRVPVGAGGTGAGAAVPLVLLLKSKFTSGGRSAPAVAAKYGFCLKPLMPAMKLAGKRRTDALKSCATSL